MRSSVSRIACLSWLAGAILVSMAAGPPEIIRVRAAASDIGKWFPEGTELISLRLDEFEKLVGNTRDRLNENRADTARILKASHRIRWEGGALLGETKFTVRRDPAGPRVLPLSPWGIPNNTADVENAQFLTADDGRVFLRLDAEGPGTVSVSWRREAVPNSEGRLFSLELPRVPLESVELDLPDRFVPEGFSRLSHYPAARDHRRIWHRSDLSSPFEIRLRERTDLDRSELERPWISGPTTIDVGPASAAWRADWRISIPPAQDSIRLVFSRGLEPIEAAGPHVESTELAHVDGRAEMTVRFRPGFQGTTTLIVRGVAHIGSDSVWSIPAAWPADAEWLGGPVTVRLDRSREMEACRVIQGRRLPITGEDAAARIGLRLEPAFPGPVAELSFRRDDMSRRARIRSWVRYSTDRAELLADVTWTFAAGLPGELALDLPGGWSVDRVTADDEPIPWHGEPSGGGSERVRLTAQSIDANATSYSARIHAVGPAPAGDSTFDVPRIVPVGAAADTLWLATATEGRHVIPLRFDGVAWLESSSFDDPGLAVLVDPAELSRALAWRSVGDREHIFASVAPAARESHSSADGSAIISGGRLHTTWRLTVRPGHRPLASIPISWSAVSTNPMRWRLRRPELPDLSLSARPMSEAQRASIGLDRSAPGVVLDLPGLASSTVVVECTSEQAWTGRGSIPLMRLPADFNLRGAMALRLGLGQIARLETHEISAMEGSGVDSAGAEFSSLELGEPTRLDHLLAYRSSNAELSVETRPSLVLSNEVIVSADLDTSLESDGTRVHDLSVRILTGSPRELAFSMPPGAELRSVRLGEQRLEVTGRGPTYSVPIAMEAGNRRPELHFAYVERPSVSTGNAHRLRPTLPFQKTTCIAFRWSLLARHDYTAGKIGGGLVAVDAFPRRSASALLGGGIGSFLASYVDSRRLADDRSTIEEIDRRLAALETSDSIGLGKALSSVARSDLTLIVDRLGFREGGMSPNSAWSSTADGPRAVSPGGDQLRRGNLCFLARHGNVAVTTASATMSNTLREVSAGTEVVRSLREAAAQGVSADGRWIVLDEWQAQPLDRSVATSEGASFAPTRRYFACNGWPGDDAWVEEVSESAGLAGLALALCIGIVSGFIARWMSRARRCTFLLLSTTAALIVLWASPGMIRDEVRWGTLLALVSAWLMQNSLPRSGTERLSSASDASRSRPVQVLTAGLILFACGSVFPARSTSYAAEGAGEERDRILAILPFEGLDPQVAPTRVILRLQDYRKLRDANAKPPEQPGIFALEATHRVSVLDLQSARVTSAITLSLETDLPQQWRFPVEGAREIRAWLDDKPHPVRIDDEGRSGVATVVGRGRRRLRLERLVPIELALGAPSIVTPVNPIACARLEVATRPSASRLGPTGGGAGGVGSGNEREQSIGCARSITLTWDVDGKPATPKKPQIQGLVCWDALPAGDLVRVRLAPVGRDSIAELRLASRRVSAFACSSIDVPSVRVPTEPPAAWSGRRTSTARERSRIRSSWRSGARCPKDSRRRSGLRGAVRESRSSVRNFRG